MIENSQLPEDEPIYCDDCSRPVYGDEGVPSLCRDCAMARIYDADDLDREDRAVMR